MVISGSAKSDRKLKQQGFIEIEVDFFTCNHGQCRVGMAVCDHPIPPILFYHISKWDFHFMVWMAVPAPAIISASQLAGIKSGKVRAQPLSLGTLLRSHTQH